MNRKLHLICAVLAATLLAWPTVAVFAQSVQDFRLEPGTPTNAPRPQGPVDEEIQIRPPSPSPTPQPQPQPQPTAKPTAEPPTIALPAARPAPAPVPRPTAEAAANRPAANAAPTASAQPATVATDPSLSSPLPAVAPAPTIEAAEAPPEGTPTPTKDAATIPLWAWLGAAIVIALAAAGWLVLRRKQAKPPVRLEPAPRPRPRPAAEPAPSVPARKTDADTPIPATALPTAGLNLQLMPKSLSASLFMATLQYRIEVENYGPQPLGLIAIAGDMIAAHASTNSADQLAAIGKDLPEMHRIDGLRPGERTELTGEIRLPLSAITPIRKGRAMLFVPLVRIYALDTGAGMVIGGGTFVVGEPPQTPGGKIRPFRLDLGPRIYPAVEQRKLAAPDAISLDGRALAS